MTSHRGRPPVVRTLPTSRARAACWCCIENRVDVVVQRLMVVARERCVLLFLLFFTTRIPVYAYVAQNDAVRINIIENDPEFTLHRNSLYSDIGKIRKTTSESTLHRNSLYSDSGKIIEKDLEFTLHRNSLYSDNRQIGKTTAMLVPWAYYFATRDHSRKLLIRAITTTVSPTLPPDIETDEYLPSRVNGSGYILPAEGSGDLPNDSHVEKNFSTSFDDAFTDIPLNFWMHGAVMPVIAIFGIFANLASFIVLTRSSMRTSVINIYLAALSAFDGLLLLNALLLYPAMSYCEITGSEPTSGWCKYFFYSSLLTYPLSLITQSGSVWTLTAITVDRFVAISWPLSSRKWCTNTRALIVVLAILVWSILYNAPAFLELTLVHDYMNDTDSSDYVTMLQMTDLRRNLDYIVAYKGYCYLIFMLLLPAGTMIVLNVYITLAVKRAVHARRSLNAICRDDTERRCTIMAVLVVGTFLILNSVAFVSNMWDGFRSDKAGGANFMRLVCVGNVLVALNSATNFIIYCVLGLRFRQMFCKLFCPYCYTPEREYQFLSVYYGSGRDNCWTHNANNANFNRDGAGDTPLLASPNAGIISMRTLTSKKVRGASGQTQLSPGGKDRKTSKGGPATQQRRSAISINNNRNDSSRSTKIMLINNNNNNNVINGGHQKLIMSSNDASLSKYRYQQPAGSVIRVDVSQRNRSPGLKRPPVYD